jgi:NAD(P)H-flavin reductase
MPRPARVVEVRDETPTIRTLVLKPSVPLRFEAGQFLELTVPRVGEAPFTPSSSPAEPERVETTIMNVGRVTRRVHQLSAGDDVGIRGPLGRPYPLDAFRGREVLIVGGGVGIAPLRSLLYALLMHAERYPKILLRYGARTPRDLVYRDSLLNGWGEAHGIDVAVTVDEADESWGGSRGVVTTILEPERLRCEPRNGVAVVCGPPIMMKFTTLKLLARGYAPEDIYLSMEKNMSCGVGKCGHCRLGPYYACKDGPVLTYSQIEGLPHLWD